GDSLGFMPANEPELVDAVLAASGLSGHAELRTRLLDQYDITTLTASPRQEGWHVIDMLEAERRTLTEEQLLGMLRPLAPRYYSIASSRKAVPDEAHLLIAAVRYAAHGRARKGVASVNVAERRRVGERMRVFLKPNAHFRLPADADRPVIMIG